jgi:flagellar motor switch protein FliG
LSEWEVLFPVKIKFNLALIRSAYLYRKARINMEKQQITDNISSLLEKTNLNLVLHAIQEEDEYSLAIFFLSLPSKHSASILSRMKSEQRNAIAQKIAITETAPAEEVKEIVERIKAKIEEAASHVTSFGDSIENLANILTQMDNESRNAILDGLEQEGAEITQRVKEKMFRFDDILLLPDSAMNTLLRMLDRNILALALKGASEEVQEKIFDNLSEDENIQIRTQMENSENVPARLITQAQQSILSAMRQLEYQGMIAVKRTLSK